MTKKVLICSACKYPSGDAPSFYYDGIGEIFRKLNYSTDFIGFSDYPYLQPIYCKQLNGNLISVKKHSNKTIISKILNHIFLSKRVIKTIKRNAKIYDTFLLTFPFSKKDYCLIKKEVLKSNPNAKLIIGVLEEYSINQFSKLNYYLKKQIQYNHYLVNEFKDNTYKILVISKYLSEKFLRRGFDVCRIPFAVKAEEMSSNNYKNIQKRKYIYAGVPSNKDNLFMMLQSFSLIENASEKIELNIFGVGKEWLINMDKGLELYEKISSFTTFHGFVPNKVIKECYAKSDFSIFLRNPELSYTKAGFPTKIVESFCSGIPVISNLTSDLSNFLVDEKNCILVKDFSIESFAEAINKSLLLDLVAIQQMKDNVNKDAYKYFSADAYVEELSKII